MNKLPENITLFQLVSILPGIYNIQHNIDYVNNVYYLFFNVKDTDEGLFILTRCMDKRYFYYGDKCNISLSVGDTMGSETNRPITYILSITGLTPPLPGKYTADRIEKEIVDNILHHLENINFKGYFKIDSDNIFNNYLTSERKRKIELIKLRRALEEAKDFSFYKNNFLNIKQ